MTVLGCLKRWRRSFREAQPVVISERISARNSPLPTLRFEIEEAEYSRDDKSSADHVNDCRETNCRMQIRSLNGAFCSPRIAVDDDLLIEIAIGLQPVGQASADQENSEEDETGKPQESQ